MPITKTAKRALRSSQRKQEVNTEASTAVEIAIREFKKNPTAKMYEKCQSLLDRAVKRGIFHKNKVSRIKGQLSKLVKKSGSSKGSSRKTKK